MTWRAKPYNGQEWKITVWDAVQERRLTILWSEQEISGEFLVNLELEQPGWSDPRCERVENRETGR